jgi:hypothetical protein
MSAITAAQIREMVKKDQLNLLKDLIDAECYIKLGMVLEFAKEYNAEETLAWLKEFSLQEALSACEYSLFAFLVKEKELTANELLGIKDENLFTPGVSTRADFITKKAKDMPKEFVLTYIQKLESLVVNDKIAEEKIKYKRINVVLKQSIQKLNNFFKLD